MFLLNGRSSSWESVFFFSLWIMTAKIFKKCYSGKIISYSRKVKPKLNRNIILSWKLLSRYSFILGFILKSDQLILIFWLFQKFQKQPPEVFCKKGVLLNFAKFIGKHLCQSLFFNKVAGLSSATLLKKRLWHRCFLVNFMKFFRTPPSNCFWKLTMFGRMVLS